MSDQSERAKGLKLGNHLVSDWKDSRSSLTCAKGGGLVL